MTYTHYWADCEDGESERRAFCEGHFEEIEHPGKFEGELVELYALRLINKWNQMLHKVYAIDTRYYL
jgi:hypothetical protein